MPNFSRLLSKIDLRQAVEQQHGAVTDEEWAAIAPVGGWIFSPLDVHTVGDAIRTKRFLQRVVSDMTTWVQDLARLDVLRGLTHEQLLLIGHLGARSVLPPGQVLAVAGEPCDHLYLILDGDVETHYSNQTRVSHGASCERW